VPLHVPSEWREALSDAPGLVFAAVHGSDEWEDVRATLREAFAQSRRAAQEQRPILYIVMNDDLLGRRGPGLAMVATGLLSAARTLALETAKSGIGVNVLAIEADTTLEAIARWVGILLTGQGPSGELVHLGVGHVGKALA
jgi:hypothetical protein